MVRINCHSAFKHYEMFHSNYCGGGHYGSIFNTTYNISCGNNGNHGGFWSGFGAGLGNAFGGLFTNLFGGMNFGGMGLWGGGMMPWGGATMPWFNSIGNNGGWWGNNANNTNNTNNDSSNSPVDKDNEKYNKLEKDVNKLLEKADKPKSKENANELYDEIKKLYEKPLDPMNEKMNKGAYHDLMTKLENKFPELKDGTDAGKDKTADNDGKAAPIASTTGKQDVVAPAKAEKDAETKKAEEAKKAAEEAAKKLKNANSMDDLLGVDYDKLSEADKDNYMQKMRAYVDAMSPDELKAKLDSLSDTQRNLVLKAIYNGAENVTEANFNELVKKGAKINIIDHSDKADFINATIEDVSGSTITIVTEHKTLKISYNKGASKYGEMIFHGAKGETQKYALQIKNGVLYLNQYKYHDGYDVADIDKNNRKNHINK